MRTIHFTEFRQKASRVLDWVEKGETVRLLRHGKSIARIVPEDTQGAPPAWKRPGLRLVVPGVSLSKAILKEKRSSP
jgi:antitoxin (DNA-binding transcriptional repressor) of toxin-antitoxin stability system